MVKVEKSETYQQITHFQNIHGKLSYLVHKIQDKIYVVYGDKEYGPYDSAHQLLPFKNGICYYAETSPQKWTVMIDGEKKSKDYRDFIYQIIEYNGEPTYQPITNEGRCLMVGEKKVTVFYPATKQHKAINNKLYMAARKPNGKWVLLTITKDSVEEGPQYKNVGSPVEVNNKIVYGAVKSDGVQVLIYDGQEMNAYEEISRIQNANGKLVYTARKAENEWYVIQEGKEHGPHFQVGPIIDYKGGIAYNASDKSGKVWNVYLNGEKQQAPAGPGIGHLSVIDDELAFVYLNKRKWCFVRVGEKDFPKEYVSAKHLMKWGDDIVFAATHGGSIVEWKVSINGTEHGEAFKEILAMVPIEDKLYTLCFSSKNFRHYIQTFTQE